MRELPFLAPSAGINHEGIPHPVPRSERHTGFHMKCPFLVHHFAETRICTEIVVKQQNIKCDEKSTPWLLTQMSG
jgi:hypothetical protein